MIDRSCNRADGLVDVDHDCLLETAGGHRPLADDGQAAVTRHLSDERAYLARAYIDTDENCFAFHSLPSSVLTSIARRCLLGTADGAVV
jgi:hypothetical protein